MSFCETRGEIPWKNLVVAGDTTAQAEELSNKYQEAGETEEKKRKRKERQEKEKLSLTAPASSENSSDCPEECGKQTAKT